MDLQTLQEYLGTRTVIAVTAISAYVLLCRSLRYRRRDQKHAQYPYKTRADMAKMTSQHAFEIVKYIYSLEYPFLVTKSLEFALFKTYGIPTISALLCKTTQLSSPATAPRRYADTTTLITEFLLQPPTSPRSTLALSRTNYLHSHHKISNKDMLYTLSLFVLEPSFWIRTYEWRPLTPLELCATATLWKDIGHRMGIDYAPLDHGPDAFCDGLEFFEDLSTWAEEYERDVMLPMESNHRLAEETIALLLSDVPRPLKPFGKQLVVTMMSERLRRAMKYDKPHPVYPFLVRSIISVRRFLLRNVFLPRPYAWRYSPISEEPDKGSGRLWQTEWVAEPWYVLYVKPTLANKFSPLSLFRHHVLGLPVPDGKNFKPEGFTAVEIGPRNMEGKGVGRCEDEAASLRVERVGCPFMK
ncbi:hypothetical protein EJ04DRAFT_492074 [Polyplosphaeria fusca]|uniref:ER-bound oxygenase mpaB/mpaB'/Rubber oxygenase catalytic domain-containing protein n=1 Tax=Polyplosphaeria fusca TaxID=682080 RepID=A0A9P4R1B5_9PLEO|nr:hypothetical protein EJ04DRAFT_492074 [Polyplosphaeria fusca]